MPAAVALIGLPLLVATFTERWIGARAVRAHWRERLGWWPVPLLAVVVFLIASTQVGTVRDAGAVLLVVTPVFAGFLLFAALLASVLMRLFNLRVDSGRAPAFSLGTRNSLVVLPFALALPTGWETTLVVIVFQSLVELFGMVFYLWWLPRYVFRASQ